MPSTATASNKEGHQRPPASSAVPSKKKPTAVAKKKKKKVAHVTPGATSSMSLNNQRMHVDKNVVDELLLVCGVIGTTVDSTADNDRIVPVTDCLNWLQDLQRALRRDDDLYRPISLLLGQWKIVQQKLLALVWSCRYDTPLVLTVVKILVILTKPLANNTVRAGRMVIDTASGKVPEAVVQEQIKLRENALAQADMRMEYKRAFCYHSSHLDRNQKKKDKTDANKKKKKGAGLLSIFVSLLTEPLSRAGSSRTDQDHLTIELVLHLFRNLLSAEPLLTTSSESQHRASILHKDMIALFDRELVLDIFLVLGAEMEQRENQPYNLLLMELIHHMLKNEDPTAVARSSKDAATPASVDDPLGGATKPASRSPLLKERREQQSLRTAPLMSSRHSHFGGTLMVQRMNGQRQYVSSTAAYAQLGQENGGAAASVPTVAKRKNKRTEAFIGNGRTLQAHTRGLEADRGPAAMRAQRALDSFCRSFIKDCYGPVMKSIKNEFRRDSVRLEDGDRVVFFRLAWFFCQWWRVSGKKVLLTDKDDKNDKTALGKLIFTMDVFTFNLVLNATDTFVEHKKHARLAQTVALLSEMMHLLHVMYTSKEPTENLMAIGLLDRLFYCGEPLDRLPRLLSKWTPGTSTREYLCDLVEVNYMTLKMLELNGKACSDAVAKATNKRDKATKMNAAAANFDIAAYFFRKIVSNHVVHMYTQLLSHYATNAPQVNHRIVSFFLRVSKFAITAPEKSDPDFPLAERTVTLEAMLYNVPMLSAMNSILNDSNVRNDKTYEVVLSFAAGLVHSFANAAKENPMLFVEAMFRHPLPHRYCESAGNLYVSEEIRLIAEREMLLEGEQEEKQADPAQRKVNASDDDDDDDDEELEIEDFGVWGGTTSMKKSKPKRKRRPKRKVVLDKDSDSDDDEASDKEQESDQSVLDKTKNSSVSEADTEGKEQGRDQSVSDKRKRSDSDDDAESTDEEGDQSEKANDPPAEVRKRLRVQSADSETGSSDEELDFGPTKSGESVKALNSKPRAIFDDDDDDDDDDE